MLKVIGAGFGRTGTTSLKAALEQLGFNKCYHMTELFQNPDQLQYWRDVRAGRPVNWDELFAGYQATVDWPTTAVYKELADHYPEAKVVLSVRDAERWYDSMTDTIYWVNYDHAANMERGLMQTYDPQARIVHNILEVTGRGMIFEDTFEGQFTDKAYTLQRFQHHIDAVKQEISADRLLVFEVKQGWEPLCEFLDVPVPDGPFPHVNDKETMRSVFSAKTKIFQQIGEELGQISHQVQTGKMTGKK